MLLNLHTPKALSTPSSHGTQRLGAKYACPSVSELNFDVPNRPEGITAMAETGAVENFGEENFHKKKDLYTASVSSLDKVSLNYKNRIPIS